MTSPFASFTNATLRFEVSSGVLVPDARGNMVPGVEVVEVSALLEQTNKPRTEYQVGIDPSLLYLEGFAVSPMQLPQISPDTPCQATWAGINGRFFLEWKGRSPWNYESTTGDEISGYFQPSTFAISITDILTTEAGETLLTEGGDLIAI